MTTQTPMHRDALYLIHHYTNLANDLFGPSRNFLTLINGVSRYPSYQDYLHDEFQTLERVKNTVVALTIEENTCYTQQWHTLHEMTIAYINHGFSFEHWNHAVHILKEDPSTLFEFLSYDICYSPDNLNDVRSPLRFGMHTLLRTVLDEVLTGQDQERMTLCRTCEDIRWGNWPCRCTQPQS